MQCQFRSSNNLASLERLIPRIKEVLPEEISMTVAFRFINDQVDTKSFYLWLRSNPTLNNETKIDIINEIANCNVRNTSTNFGFSVINAASCNASPNCFTKSLYNGFSATVIQSPNQICHISFSS